MVQILIFFGLLIHSLAVKLNDGWEFYYQGNWYPTSIPSNNILDLFSHNLIQDPYVGINSEKGLEYDQLETVYRNLFNITVRDAIIKFHGIDTFADIYLNNKQLLSTNNMFREWEVLGGDLTGISNLTLQFKSAQKYQEQQQKIKHLQIAAGHTRKAIYQFGWDWCPVLVSSGLWKDVEIFQQLHQSIKNIFIRTLGINQNQGIMMLKVDLKLENRKELIIQFSIMRDDFTFMIRSIKVTDQNMQIQFNITNPKLWWPNNHGEPHLYEIFVQLFHQNKMLDVKTTKFGIRTSKWIQKKDNKGESFYLEINNKNIYVMGANYIPPEMLMPRALQQDMYLEIFQQLLDTNANCVRIWGGGQYEYDRFYELADQYGILIWHDLMFANTIYPITTEFLDNVKLELEDNISRLRNHPSIVLWSGNNEIKQGIEEWWGQGNNKSNINDYEKLFKIFIPEILTQLDPDRYYIPSSPLTTAHDISFKNHSGDIHYWGVWAGGRDIETYENYIGRFNSEYGMQSFPEISTVHKFAPGEYQMHQNSLHYHQKHLNGISLLRQYMQAYTNDNSKDLLHLIYLTNIVQYISLSTAIRALRINKPFNMGTIYWQLNDAWPGISWSSIDYYGCRKGGHYAAKLYQQDLMIGVKMIHNEAQIYLTSEHQTNGSMVVRQLQYYDSSVIQEKSINNLSISDQESQLAIRMQINATDLNSTYLELKFHQDHNSQLITYYYSFGRPKLLQLSKPTIKAKQIDDLTYEFSTNVFAKYVYIYNEQICLNPSDNYFDLSPLQSKIIKLQRKGQFNIQNYFDSLNF